ncbi:phosphoribosylformylglycinamidine synthase I [Candidatus Roizmanbacteria bacterium RIFCSPHIGHO2_02_FULL_37_13b]|uniref:Phosphoribosylformylglycinamidine synthase I n=1 Tax=Candidatus Roizmanbacteria bacterium RIFCSPLOWO2_02_FULL_36_11 TaxID=1802071 RepID=A0A1F7JHP7_9BACT|nr:MAG: phosphoribosylformylglycinamidine synthase I [Candidatus Roizmanbacteria bacterium RIFCSPHIGHO2_02_FULL_37_13b]OGK55117.1 MAG: phosphoribosylformylglycinamidine synthase I [Candidatus Roizmanbacteria bacterium RIFCSPLOWO2_02_FULL_36_11]
MIKPKIIVLSGYGLNCEEETAYGFQLAGGDAEIVHINDIIDKIKKLDDYQILGIPGGFAFGDHTGSGKAYANKIKNHLTDQLNSFIESDKLVIGICNGFQILTNCGLLPGALTFNESARYINRWIDLKVVNKSPWLKKIKNLSLPVAHGEGKYYLPDKELSDLKKNNQVAVKYIKGEMYKEYGLAYNPNGALSDIAGITDKTGRIFGLMPHPDRALFFTQLPHWTRLKERYLRNGKDLPEHGPGLQIFKNGVDYFK